MDMGVGDKIKLARESLGWNQERLASEIGVETPTISRWETNLHAPRPKHWPALVEALGRPREWFEREDTGLSEIEARLKKIEAAQSPSATPEARELWSAWAGAAEEPWRRSFALFFLTGDRKHLEAVTPEYRKRLLEGLRFHGMTPAKKDHTPKK